MSKFLQDTIDLLPPKQFIVRRSVRITGSLKLSMTHREKDKENCIKER